MGLDMDTLVTEPVGGESATRAEMRLYARALCERWPIPPEVRAKILGAAIELCTTRGPDGALKASRRMVVAALRVIAAFDRLSLERLKIEIAGRAAAPRGDGPAGPAAPGLAPEDAAQLLALINEPTDPCCTPGDPAGDP